MSPTNRRVVSLNILIEKTISTLSSLNWYVRLVFSVAWSSNNVQHLPRERDFVQRGEREGGPAFRPLHRVSRTTRSVPQVPSDDRKNWKPIYQVTSNNCLTCKQTNLIESRKLLFIRIALISQEQWKANQFSILNLIMANCRFDDQSS